MRESNRSVDTVTLDDFHYRLTCGIDMLDAVRAGIKDNTYSEEVADNALYGAVLYPVSLRDELGQMVEQGQINQSP